MSKTYAEHVREKLQNPQNRRSMRQVGRAIGYSYEHIRKVVSGEVTFTEEFSNALCKELGLPAEKMWELAQTQKILKKFGSAVKADLPRDPRVREIWASLDPQARETWIGVGLTLARR